MYPKKIKYFIQFSEKTKEPLSLKELVNEEILLRSRRILQISDREIAEKTFRNHKQDLYRSIIRKKTSNGLSDLILLFKNLDSIETAKTSAKPLVNYHQMDRLCYIWITQIRKRYSETDFLKFLE